MEFLHPNVFYVLMIPLVVLFFLIITSKTGVNRYFTKEILERLAVQSNMLDKKSRNFLFFLVLILFIIALARPVIDKKEQNIKQNLIPIVVALDVSKSMLAQDVFPNRIELAKKKLETLIEYSKNTTIGVVLFAQDSFILSPVTEDFLSLKYIVNNLNTDLNFANGSNIYSVLEATKYMLEDFKVKNLIILSDGGNDNRYEEELEFSKENDIVVYSIGIATKEGSPIPIKTALTTNNTTTYMTNKNGEIVTVKLNESIKEFSLKSAGGYIDFTLDDTDIKAIINRINQQSKKEELNIQKIKTYTELFYYPLALGLLLLLIALSSVPTLSKRTLLKNKNGVKGFLIFCLCCTFQTQSKAFSFDFENIEKAKKAYENKEYSKASDAYRQVSSNAESLYNLANSLYKEKKYDDAIKTYNKVITQDKALEQKKLYNLGNSYVKKNDLEKAKEMYEKALKIKEDKDTKENLEKVNEVLKKQKEKNQNQNKQKDNKDSQKQQKNSNKDENNQKENKNSQDKQKSKENKDSKEKQNKEKSSQKNDSKNEKSKQKKSQEKNQENDKNQKKEDSLKNNKFAEKNTQKSSTKEQEKILSDREEKKWMNMLQNQKTPIYLQKVNSQKEKGGRDDSNQPW